MKSVFNFTCLRWIQLTRLFKSEFRPNTPHSIALWTLYQISFGYNFIRVAVQSQIAAESVKDCSLPRSIFVNFWLKNSFNHFALKRQVVEHIKGYLMSLITFKFKVIFKDFYGIDVLPWLENIQTASQIKMSTQHSIEKIAFYGLARSTWPLQREIPAEILRSVSKCFFFLGDQIWMNGRFLPSRKNPRCPFIH